MAQYTQLEVTDRPCPATTMRVGLVQTSPVFGDIDANLAEIRALQETLQSVDLAVTPELSATGYGFTPLPTDRLLTADDPRIAALATGPGAIGIGFAEPNPSGRPWNSYLVADPLTKSSQVQHKLHPVSYSPWNEHQVYQPGDTLDTAEFRGARTATIICNDMWHPSLPWLAAHRGAEVLIVPVASIEGGDLDAIRRTWQVILKHAALVLQCYVVFVNRCGPDSGERFWGGSRVVGPDGKVLAALGDEPGTAVADLDLVALRRLRAAVPVLPESRADLLTGTLLRQPATDRSW